MLKIEQGPLSLIKIYRPNKLEIRYLLSPFGEIPYEKTIFAQLKLAEPLDGCK